MTHFGSSTMLSGGPGAGVLDADYEAFCGTARWELQYWWPQRVWRWVKTARLEWGRCQPADPEQALDDSAPILQFDSRLKGSGRALLAELETHGPGTFRELARRLGRNVHTMDNLCRRMVDMGHARVTGHQYEASAAGFHVLAPVYGLPSHPDAPPPVRRPRPSPVIDYLRACGEWRSTRQLVAETGRNISAVKAALLAHKDTVEMRVEAGERGVRVPYYRFRQEAQP